MPCLPAPYSFDCKIRGKANYQKSLLQAILFVHPMQSIAFSDNRLCMRRCMIRHSDACHVITSFEFAIHYK
ncbi:hypothetical protein BaLi_c06350 [Bacillus paralicheniformis ATCC 9945a]|nr:hypothetical protein BaLi_c06350 [Bacillus paralicheniformis ATCC 9945a]